MEKLIRAYIYSAGSLFLAWATILMLANFQKPPTDFVPARDLVLNLQLPALFWTVGGMLLTAALLCLFGRQTRLQLTIVLWLATNLILYRIGLYYLGAKGGVQGYLGAMSDAFGVSTGTLAGLQVAAVWYLVIGSLSAMALNWVAGKISISRAKSSRKMACARCGGHILFPLRNLGQKIACPHCQNRLTLRQPEENLKMACFFCQGHIEFSPHAIGEKSRCPHCNMDITLKEPVNGIPDSGS